MLIPYILFTLALVVTPGATTALVVRNTLAGGRAAGFATAAGAALANTSYAVAAGLGLAVVLSRWPGAFTVVRLAGGAYLAWLGGVTLWRAIRYPDGGLASPSPGDAAGAPESVQSAQSAALSSAQSAAPGSAQSMARRSVAQGIGVNLLNPAIATFYLVVVPSFVPAGAPRGRFATLAAIHVVLAFLCHGAWALTFDRIRRFLHRPVARRALAALSGGALLGLASRVIG